MTVATALRPSSPEPESTHFAGDLVDFRPRMSDFAWGTKTGDFAGDFGYRIYPAWFRDTWVLIDRKRKRLGEYPDLHRAIKRAEDNVMREIEEGRLVWADKAMRM